MSQKSKDTVYAFIDAQNLKLGVGKDVKDEKTGKLIYKGWEMDYRKFRLYLKNKYGVSKAYFLSEIYQAKDHFMLRFKIWDTTSYLSQRCPLEKMVSEASRVM